MRLMLDPFRLLPISLAASLNHNGSRMPSTIVRKRAASCASNGRQRLRFKDDQRRRLAARFTAKNQCRNPLGRRVVLNFVETWGTGQLQNRLHRPFSMGQREL